MTRNEWFLSIFMISCTCAFLIWCKFLFASTLLQSQIVDIDLNKKKQQLKSLKLEWIKLNSPEKLKKLAEKHFPEYTPVYSKQISKHLTKSIQSNISVDLSKVDNNSTIVNETGRNVYNNSPILEKNTDVVDSSGVENVNKKKKKFDLNSYLDTSNG